MKTCVLMSALLLTACGDGGTVDRGMAQIEPTGGSAGMVAVEQDAGTEPDAEVDAAPVINSHGLGASCDTDNWQSQCIEIWGYVQAQRGVESVRLPICWEGKCMVYCEGEGLNSDECESLGGSCQGLGALCHPVP